MKNKNIYKGIISIFFILGFFIFAAGCASIGSGFSSSSNPNASSGISSTAKFLKFDDVPIPAGFKLIDNESFSFQNDQMRVGLLKYAGMPEADRVVNFYKEQMPLYNWDLINVIEYGQRVMNFERRDQTCIITIQPQSTRTVISIAVAPKAHTTMTEEKVQKYKELKTDYSKMK